MNLIINSKNLEITPSIENKVQQYFSSVFEKHNFIVSTNVYLSLTNDNSKPYKVEALLKVKGKEIFASDSGTDMYSIIETLVQKLNIQLKKYKEKNHTHKGSISVKDLPTEEDVL